MSTDRLGLDIGALFVKGVRLNAAGRMVDSFYQAHHGDPGKALEAALVALRVRGDEAIGITGSAAALFADTLGVEPLDITRCQIEAVHRSLPKAVHIIDIGGASATMILLDEHGRFQGFTTNSLCAAGTGSFLDEQAHRLGISYEDLARFEPVAEPPSIATRCSVFAKSDLIHRQQEGYSKAAMWSGLCRGMTRTLLATLLNGQPLAGTAAVIGGVAQNLEVLRWLRVAQPGLIQVPEHPHLVAATGAARLAVRLARPLPRTFPAQASHDDQAGQYSWPLTMETSLYPSFDTQKSWVDEHDNEVRLIHWPTGATEVRGVLGIDIGSTSTKAALVDEAGRVVLDVYRKTGGDPIGATKLLFVALRELQASQDAQLVIEGVGTTGSGRKMVGQVIGADAIINEISSHVAGAVQTDPAVDTIFEIGGQDSKYMHVIDGHIRDANMNYVCAAGTGSFVEEQANKLGYPVAAVGPAVLGRHPPRTSDRCTVFMEQDVARLVQSGTAPEDALAGVMVSVVKNYLSKVVGNRHRSRTKIFFQGATARNPALVAAFERLLGVQMVVSPYCHVMGAFGVALLTRRLMQERNLTSSSFRGLDLDRRQITIRSETCHLCQNDCKITYAEIEGLTEKPSWGYLCGRDPDEQRVRVNPHEKALRLRTRLWREAGAGLDIPENAPVIGLPQALTMHTYLPLWRRFFNRLGFRVELSGQTTDAIRELGNRLTGAEFCFPAKVALGHAATLATRAGVDFVFLPHMVSEEKPAELTAAKFCPYVQAWPAYSRTAMNLNGLPSRNVLSPVIDLRMKTVQLIDQLHASMGPALGSSREEIGAAWQDALRVQREFENRLLQEGARILEAARDSGERLLVLLGRPYNNYDSGLNLGLPRKLAEQGRTVLPMDMLGADVSSLGERYRNIYWSYGAKILAACAKVATSDNLDAVYLTNFNCGPDSFLLSYAEEIFGNRPFLALELDEHGADAGYMTRIEAYFDVLRRPRSQPAPRRPLQPEPRSLRDRVLWIPPMHELSSRFLAAAFRRAGWDCRAIPPEDREAFELGRSLTRGSECLPTALTLGGFLKAIENSGLPPERHAFFMPTAEGPCRFGQYCTLHRQVLDRLGLVDTPIMTPSSFNSYQGIDEGIRRNIWLGILAGDYLFKAACKVRPYEVNPGETNRVKEEQARLIEAAIEHRGNLATALRQAVARIQAIPRTGKPRPLVGVVGEIYIRCNTFANEDVIGAIERFGGEAWLSPVSEWILYTATAQRLSFRDGSGNLFARWLAALRNQYLFRKEHQIAAAAGPFVADRHEPPMEDVLRDGTQMLPMNFEGEAVLTLGRTIQYARQGAALVVNCAPFGCMPGTLTTAMFRKIAPEIGIPVVSMFYDGAGRQNERLSVFLQNAVGQERRIPAGEQPVPADTDRPVQPEISV